MSLIDVEQLISATHPIRLIKTLCDKALSRMDGHFDEIYSADGAPSIPPETLLKGKVLQALYTIRSDRQLCERLQTDLLFRWFVDLPLDEAPFDASTYSKNQTRLLCHQVAELFFCEVVGLAREHGWVSNDHFSVDSTLIEAWASMKSFKPKADKSDGPGTGGNSWTDFKGQSRTNDTHESATDPEAKLLRKGPGKEARLCFAGHATMENRNGLCLLFQIRKSVGASEPQVAVEQIQELQSRGFNPKTVGADKGYHAETFVQGMRKAGVVPHPALQAGRRKMRVILTATHAASQKTRKRIEELFGWAKTTGCFRKTRYHGVDRTNAQSQYVMSACNLVRMAKLFVTSPPHMLGA